MLIGLGSYIFRYAVGTKTFQHENQLSPLQVVEKASEFGAEVLQFADNLPLDDLSSKDLKELKIRANNLNIRLEAGMAGLTKDRLLKNLDIAKQLKTELLRVATHHDEIEPSIDEIVTILEDVLPEFESSGISIAIENHFTIPSKDLVTIIERVDSPLVGICLDTGNNIAQMEWPHETTEILAPYVISLHLKDFYLSMEPNGLGVNVRGRTLRENDDYVKFHIDTVKKYRDDFNIILEQWMPAENTVKETLAKEEAWIKENIRISRQYL
ncbi:sugar phosphate isomerase/epimerase family protein [Virgibacillus sp. JSM 102003]|uniref:sugar phosphate isomerase/epimerase family protein n=1 Tax=Virgibacillus sp. JSM 102003 TaxID=1562108 RepID=UPI0035C1FEA8